MEGIDQAKNAFHSEAHELLEQMEDALLQLEDFPDDSDLINSLFRAAHTIKGTGGVFGFEHVSSFTHVAESLLEQIRAGHLAINADIIALLLVCRDHIGVLVDSAVFEIELTDDDIGKNHHLLGRLCQFLNIDSVSMDKSTDAASAISGVENPSAPENADQWQIFAEFSADALRNGIDPLSFIRYLKKTGVVNSVKASFGSMPDVEQMDPETCYLSYEISYTAENASKLSIEKIFEFVRDDVMISILPPPAKTGAYIGAIDKALEGPSAFGDILTRSGSITEAELNRALVEQNRRREDNANGETVARIGEILIEQKAIRPELVEAVFQKQEKTRAAKQIGARQLRVDADKLDKLINLVGELVIAGASANLLAQCQGDGSLLESMSSMSRLVEEIRDSALRLRMVQISEIFNRFPRVVRDVSREIGKNIELELLGGDTELDKSMVEKLGDPLMHLVRNSMDHGIEPEDIRVSKGKLPSGVVRLNAYHDSGSVVIQVLDDGKGLDTKKLLAKAVEKGLVDINHAGSMSESEIFRLIFEPGFSTAETVTNLSGRGVGMDVVRKNIEALRGTIDIESVLDEGTTINIRLPLTLAIIDGFLVEVEKAAYVIPLDTVVECIELNAADPSVSAQSNYINLRGKVLPFLRLRKLFSGNLEHGKRENIVVVQYGGHIAGLVVDSLLGEFQTVIKPLGKIFERLAGISGSTILGTGEVAVILDVPGLINQAIAANNNAVALDSPTRFCSSN